MRTEKDALGKKQIPDHAWYGVHTARSLENFKISGETVPAEIIRAIAKLKIACAKANEQLGLLPADKSKAIVKACERIIAGELADQFPLDVFQAGSGTSTNMNVNEVVADLAAVTLGGKPGDRSRVHPNDDVNKGQSTNDIFPSAIKIAGVELSEKLLPALRRLVGALEQKKTQFAHLIKSGRTHLQDAVPITLGQEFGAYAHAIKKDIKRIEAARLKLLELGVGGNAIGTGINTKPEFRSLIIRKLGRLTGETYVRAVNGIETTQFLTDIAEMSAMLRLLALDIQKICNDLRLLSSGPHTGFNEIHLPAVEPGSSIMPGKVNPSICESANMACLQVMGCDHAIALACGAGQLELNTHMPLIGSNLVKSLKLLEHTCLVLTEKCIKGITANEEQCRRNFERSAGLATILNPKLGYDKVALLVKESLATGKTLRELVLKKKILSEAEFDDLLRRSTAPTL